MMKLIFDAHLDLAMNAMEWNRDLRLPVHALRKMEKGMNDKPDRSRGTVAFPEMQRGHVGLVMATLIARYVKPGNPLPGWHSPEQAWAQTQAQLTWYKTMEEAGELIQIHDLSSLYHHTRIWLEGKDEAFKSIGYILSLEGADSIVYLHYLEKSYAMGLRALGPAHYGPGTYAMGTDSIGGLGHKGIELLKEMEMLNLILDVTHLSDVSFWEALKLYKGPVWASHHNVRHLVNHNRQLSDEMIMALIERGAIIGGSMDAWMLVPGWQRGISTPSEMNVSLENLVDHFDHICQLAGNSLHIGIGSDLDGAFGKEQCPQDLDTIADLQKIPDILRRRGYTEQDIENVMYKNFLHFIRVAWGDE
jgi:membrane dipeptidase